MNEEIIGALRHLLHEISVRYEVNMKPQFDLGLSPTTINCPEDVVNLVGREMQDLAQEQLRILMLDTRNVVLAQRVIYQGNVNSSVVRPSEVLRPAIIDSATCLILVHNHPSGDPTPSGADCSVNRDIMEAGKLMGIELIDHVVVGKWPKFVSLKESRLGGW